MSYSNVCMTWGIEWEKAYFAKYEDEMIYAWDNGRTSFSARNEYDTFIWDRAKLAEV